MDFLRNIFGYYILLAILAYNYKIGIIICPFQVINGALGVAEIST
jgi:hypothetical protein